MVVELGLFALSLALMIAVAQAFLRPRRRADRQPCAG